MSASAAIADPPLRQACWPVVSAPLLTLPHSMGEGKEGGRRNVMNNAGQESTATDR